MNKLLINLTACAFGLVLGSAVIAADKIAPEKDTAPQAAQSDTQAAADDKAGSMTPDKANKPDEPSPPYVAALKKCEAMSGPEKDTCEKKAKKDHAKM